MAVYFPSYFRIYEKDGDNWYLHKGKKFFSQSNISLEKNKLESRYGFTLGDILKQFFWVGRGQTGFYLADLKHRKFYFCGNSRDAIQETFWNLGITRPDPQP